MHRFFVLALLLLTGCQVFSKQTKLDDSPTSAAAATEVAPTTTPLLLQMTDALTTNPQLVVLAAATLGDRASLKALRARGTSLDSREPEMGQTALHQLVLDKNLRAVALLIEEGADVNVHGGNGTTPLYDAISLDDYATARLLLEHHANPDFAENALHLAPLHVAASDRNTTSSALLLKFKADPNIKNINGVTPLHLAANAGSVPLVKMLLAAGADPKLKTNAGKLAVDVARDRKNEELVGLLK